MWEEKENYKDNLEWFANQGPKNTLAKISLRIAVI